MSIYIFVAFFVKYFILNHFDIASADLSTNSLLSKQVGLATLFPTNNNGLKLNPSVEQLCDMTTDQLIKYYGYEVDSYNVTTEDGYILTIFRCYSSKFPMDELEPIILQHGMISTSDVFCMNPGVQSLAYFFASKKYIVYMPNSRGNRYSRTHQTLDPNQNPGKFWNFSWTEMGVFDLPAVIDSVIEKSKRSQIPCIGHSQGATMFLVLLSMRPEYNSKIKHVGLMAPFSYVSNTGFPLNMILKFFQTIVPYTDWEFWPNTVQQRILAKAMCQMNNGLFCNQFINMFHGTSIDQRNDTMLPVYLCHYPSSCSANQLIHFGQEMELNYFGPMMHSIGSKTPKEFPIDKVTAPISIHYSTADPHTHSLDIKKLQLNLPNVVDVQEIKGFNHLDFLWGIHTHEIVYSRIYQLLKNHTT
ncbi:lipase 1-like [Contarinia nasturtii]|uniref:lipase 1-like n=1 Tax=Contarinia nasturtii TaxID=265458 RepID=UPI0012D3B1F2|nr:lipase 1-like [Contarinia nasturtii]